MTKKLLINKAPPALIALLIQAIAFVLTISIYWLAIRLEVYLPGLPAFFPNLALLFVAQGIIAYFLSIWLQVAHWWRYIQLLFPLAIWAGLTLQIPTGYFLAGFILSGTLFWSVFLTQVPFYPSKPEVWNAVAKIQPNKKLRILEIGSGLGNFAIRIAHLRPESIVQGIEIAPLPWLISRVQAKLLSSPVQFRLGSYEKVNFGNYDLVFAYLSPAAMPRLWEKVLREMNADSLLISHEFPVPDILETQKISFSADQRECYIYQIGEFRPA
jgi:hypothetical protein